MKKFVAIAILLSMCFLTLSVYAEGTVEITSSKTANVRAKPNTDSAVVGRVQPGDTYTYTAIADNGWVKLILPDGTEGYISGKMATIISGDPKSNNATDPAGLFKADGTGILTFGMSMDDVKNAAGMTLMTPSQSVKTNSSGNPYLKYDSMYARPRYDFTFAGLKVDSNPGSIMFVFNKDTGGLRSINFVIRADDSTTTKKMFDSINKVLKPLYGKYTQEITGEYENTIQIGRYKQTSSGYSADYTWDCGNGASIILSTKVKTNKKDFQKYVDISVTIKSEQ